MYTMGQSRHGSLNGSAGRRYPQVFEATGSGCWHTWRSSAPQLSLNRPNLLDIIAPGALTELACGMLKCDRVARPLHDVSRCIVVGPRAPSPGAAERRRCVDGVLGWQRRNDERGVSMQLRAGS